MQGLAIRCHKPQSSSPSSLDNTYCKRSMDDQLYLDSPPTYADAVILSVSNLVDIEKNSLDKYGYPITDEDEIQDYADSIERADEGRHIGNNIFCKYAFIVLILELILIICLLYGLI